MKPEFEILFWSRDGSAARRGQVSSAVPAVDRLAEQHLRDQPDDVLVRVIQKELSVQIPRLKRDEVTFERTIKSMDWVDMWGDRGKRDVVVFYFEVPYEGEDIIFEMKPDTFSLNPPRGQARRGKLRFSVLNEEDPQKLKAAADSTLDDVEEYLGWHRKLWEGLEADIDREARQRLAFRRERLSKLNAAESGLADLGFKPKKP